MSNHEMENQDDPANAVERLSRGDSIVERTRNFLALYLHMVGEGETPTQWHYWSAISLLGASVMNRVWVETYDNRKIRPSLYVLLLGPSGGGKSYAIKQATKLAYEAGIPDVLSGRVTREGILDRMGKWSVDSQGQNIPPNPNLYLIQDELAANIRTNEHGHAFLTMMTDLYTREEPWMDVTRTSGIVTIQNPCINWLAGTTLEWLQSVIPEKALEGGLLARILCVWGERNFKKKYPRILLPPDHQAVRQHLVRRVAGYTWMEGVCKFTAEAEARRCDWYMSLPDDPEEHEKSILNRADEMVQRLALIFALAELDITPGHVVRGCWPMTRDHLDLAIETWQWVFGQSALSLKMTRRDVKADQLDEVRKHIRRAQRISHSHLMQRVSPRGIRKRELREIIETLHDQREVDYEWGKTTHGRETTWYVWIGGPGYGDSDRAASPADRSRLGSECDPSVDLPLSGSTDHGGLEADGETEPPEE